MLLIMIKPPCQRRLTWGYHWFYVRTNMLLRTVTVGIMLLACAAAGLLQRAASTLFPA